MSIFAQGDVWLRDNPPSFDFRWRPAFTSFPSSFDYDVTSRRGKQVTIRLRLTSGATRVALGIERGDTARFPQC
jgi:hypothetical protein